MSVAGDDLNMLRAAMQRRHKYPPSYCNDHRKILLVLMDFQLKQNTESLSYFVNRLELLLSQQEKRGSTLLGWNQMIMKSNIFHSINFEINK